MSGILYTNLSCVLFFAFLTNGKIMYTLFQVMCAILLLSLFYLLYICLFVEIVTLIFLFHVLIIFPLALSSWFGFISLCSSPSESPLQCHYFKYQCANHVTFSHVSCCSMFFFFSRRIPLSLFVQNFLLFIYFLIIFSMNFILVAQSCSFYFVALQIFLSPLSLRLNSLQLSTSYTKPYGT